MEHIGRGRIGFLGGREGGLGDESEGRRWREAWMEERRSSDSGDRHCELGGEQWDVLKVL